MREEWWLLHAALVSPGTPSDPRKHSPTPALWIQCMSDLRQSTAFHAANHDVLPCCSCIQVYSSPISRQDQHQTGQRPRLWSIPITAASALSNVGSRVHLGRLKQSPQAAPFILQPQHLLPQPLQLILSRPCLHLCSHITNVAFDSALIHCCMCACARAAIFMLPVTL